MRNLLFGMPVMLVLVAAPAGAITIGIEPAAQQVAVASSVNVNLVISDLGDGIAPSLSAFDVDLTFDDGVLSFLGATFGDTVLGDQLDLTGIGPLNGVTPAAGVVNLFELSLDPPSDLDDLQAGAFVLATLTFGAQASGISALGLSILSLGDADGNSLTADILTESISVQSVDAVVAEPASFALLLAGLAGLSATRIKRIKRWNSSSAPADQAHREPRPRGRISLRGRSANNSGCQHP